MCLDGDLSICNLFRLFGLHGYGGSFLSSDLGGFFIIISSGSFVLLCPFWNYHDAYIVSLDLFSEFLQAFFALFILYFFSFPCLVNFKYAFFELADSFTALLSPLLKFSIKFSVQSLICSATTFVWLFFMAYLCSTFYSVHVLFS